MVFGEEDDVFAFEFDALPVREGIEGGIPLFLEGLLEEEFCDLFFKY